MDDKSLDIDTTSGRLSSDEDGILLGLPPFFLSLRWFLPLRLLLGFSGAQQAFPPRRLPRCVQASRRSSEGTTTGVSLPPGTSAGQRLNGLQIPRLPGLSSFGAFTSTLIRLSSFGCGSRFCLLGPFLCLHRLDCRGGGKCAESSTLRVFRGSRGGIRLHLGVILVVPLFRGGWFVGQITIGLFA